MEINLLIEHDYAKPTKADIDSSSISLTKKPPDPDLSAQEIDRLCKELLDLENGGTQYDDGIKEDNESMANDKERDTFWNEVVISENVEFVLDDEVVSDVRKWRCTEW